MKSIFISFILSSVFLKIQAQQLTFSSQFVQHNPLYNPAASGISEKNSVGMNYKSLWKSFPGSPKTYMIHGDVELKNIRSGISGFIYNDVTGPTSRTGVQMGYAYHLIPRGEKNYTLSVGLEARVLQFSYDKAKLASALANDPILNGKSTSNKGDAGAGVYFTNDKLSLGAAVQQLIQTKLKLASLANTNSESRLYRQYNFTGSYFFPTGDGTSLTPNFLLRVEQNAPTEFDFGCKVNYKDIIWSGVNWRINQGWNLQLGCTIANKLQLGYSYDYYSTPINEFSGGSGGNEFSLRYLFNK